MLTNLTDEGRKTIKANPQRIKEVNKEVEAMGVKILDQYALLGQYDFINILEAASNYFEMLSVGSFAGLKADFDDKGDPVLKAVRATDNTPLGISDLSDGARDQMFLALRLGALARHIQKSGSIPFIVDDVLVHFDDQRSFAALQALAGLAAKTQIIFFTHHKHLLALAAKAVPQQLLGTYKL